MNIKLQRGNRHNLEQKTADFIYKLKVYVYVKVTFFALKIYLHNLFF